MRATTRLISRLTVITGGSEIGQAICQQFASEGATVVVADISEESDHIAAAVDVSSRESVENDTLLQCRYFQPPSVCVNAAGVTQDEFLLKMEEDFDKVIQATFLLTQAVGKALVASGAPKRCIITVGSNVGKVGNIEQANYSASKAVVEGTPWLCNMRFPKHQAEIKFAKYVVGACVHLIGSRKGSALGSDFSIQILP
uniref:Hydroxysteroid (17-beta) dehydrogenase 8 n=1 Tax=Hucho hucho TaxID=62062 RepID=A0A4W5RXQ4_9TELE